MAADSTGRPVPETSPPWGRPTKVIVVVTALLLVALLLWRFQTLLGMIVVAAILAYLLDPLISFIGRRVNIRRGILIVIVYALLAALVIGGFFALGLASYQQAVTLINQAPQWIQGITNTVVVFINSTEPLDLGIITVNPSLIQWDQITQQILGLAEPVLSQSGVIVSRLATSTVRTVFNVIFIFIISMYLATDLPRLGGYVRSFAEQPGYGDDVEHLLPGLRGIWRAFLRGQIILALVIFVLVWLGLTILGVQNSLALGLLAGLLEFVPTLGPVISAIITMIVAFFQPTNTFGIPSWQFALLVLGLMILIQQLENHLLVPRIVGGVLHLHPVIVIVAVFMGAALAGILGAILAAPVVASIKLIGGYAWRKLLDLPPFPETQDSGVSPPLVPAPEALTQPEVEPLAESQPSSRKTSSSV